MGNIHTTTVTEAHPYTRSSVPWQLGDEASVYGKLIHYLSGGGMRTFGRTVRQEEVRRRQRRFLYSAGVLALAWVILLVF